MKRPLKRAAEILLGAYLIVIAICAVVMGIAAHNVPDRPAQTVKGHRL